MSQPNGGTFDIVILGAGSGGYAAALRAAELDLSVALIDKAELGGTCLHRGCIPTKALLHAAEVADSARESEQFGVNATLEGIDMGGVNKYKDGVVSRLFKGLTGLIKGRGITVVEGEGRLVAKDTVQVGDRQVKGRHVVLATGSYARSSALDTSASSAATSRGRASTMVTSAPKERHTLANSQPITPPPSTIAERGTRSSVSACSEVSTRWPSTSRPGSDRE